MKVEIKVTVQDNDGKLSEQDIVITPTMNKSNPFVGAASKLEPAPSTGQTSGEVRANFHIRGMHCASCAGIFERGV